MDVPDYVIAVNDLAQASDLASPLASNLERIDLFPHESSIGSFRNFLITDRVLLILKLRLAFDVVEGKSFLKGFEKFSYEPIVEPDMPVNEDEIVHIPNVLLKQLIEYDSFVDMLLGDSGISTIDAQPFFQRNDLLWTVNGLLKTPTSDEFREDSGIPKGVFYLATDGSFVLEDCGVVWCTPELAPKVWAIITDLSAQLNAFLDEFSSPDTLGVAHAYYVQWFQKLFPGKIKYRTLSHSGL